MEASTAVAGPALTQSFVEPVEQAEAASRPTSAIAEKAEPLRMFKFSRYVHVGPGAEDCINNGEDCTDQTHFHAWLRLPNKFQHRDIHEKAAAARARHARRLRDPESDAYAKLEGDLDEIRRNGDEQVMIDDLLKGEWASDYLASVEEVDSHEEYATIAQDRERYQALVEAGEDQRSEEEQSDEFRELHRHTGEYLQAIKAELARVQEPKRQAFAGLGREGMVERLRDQQIEQDIHQTFMGVYNEWMWFIGTLSVERHAATGMPHRRVWSAVGSLEKQVPGTLWAAAPEVIEAIEEGFQELERALQEGARGN